MIDAIKEAMKVDTGWDWGTILGWVVVATAFIIAVYKAITYRYSRAVGKAFASGQAAKDLDWIKATLVRVEKACNSGAQQLSVLNKKAEGHNRRLLRIEKELKLNGYGDKD